MDKAHHIQSAKVDGSELLLTVDGTDHVVDLCAHSDRLASASQSERANFVLSASGYGIHWPDVDEDLAIDGLIGITHPSPLIKSTA